MKRFCSCVLAIFLMGSLCACGAPGVPAAPPVSQPTAPPAARPPETTHSQNLFPGNTLSLDLLEEVRSLLFLTGPDHSLWVGGALNSLHGDPTQMDLAQLIANGLSAGPVSQEETDYTREVYRSRGWLEEGESFPYLDLVHTTSEDLDELLRTHFEIRLEEADLASLQDEIYYAPTGTYLNHIGGLMGIEPTELLGGTPLDDGSIAVYYTYFQELRILTLQKKEGVWIFRSNLLLDDSYPSEALPE